MTASAAQLQHTLNHEGIVALEPLYTPAELQAIKTAIDPLLASRLDEKRAYVHPDEMVSLGIWDMVFSEKMLALLFSIMPDPVLYHCHIYEIAANNNAPHIFGDSLAGWHRDEDSEYASGIPTHISLFVYLTDVGAGDGAFEFVPSKARQWLTDGTPYISVMGKAGYTFAWNRPYFHRASPNRGPVRRRLLKLSFQRNQYPSVHLGNPHFQQVLKMIAPGNVEMDLLLGRYQGKEVPKLRSFTAPAFTPVAPNEKMVIGNKELFKVQLRKFIDTTKKRIKQRLSRNPEVTAVAYD